MLMAVSLVDQQLAPSFPEAGVVLEYDVDGSVSSGPAASDVDGSVSSGPAASSLLSSGWCCVGI